MIDDEMIKEARRKEILSVVHRQNLAIAATLGLVSGVALVWRFGEPDFHGALLIGSGALGGMVGTLIAQRLMRW